MNPALDTECPPSAAGSHQNGAAAAALPSNWREALLALLAARVALMELEFKQSAQTGARRLLCLGAVAGCIFFMWALLLAGGIAILAESFGWPWYGIALGASAFHLLAAIGFAQGTRHGATPAFAVTRAEFHKDRQWIENLQTPAKSNG